MDLKLLTTDEAAKYLGLSAQILTRWRCKNEFDLPYIKMGGTVRYAQTDLEKWIEKKRIVPNEQKK